MGETSEVIVRMEGIRKSFARTAALADGNLEVRRGEVHALMGQNGAGKSTLIKVLTGVHAADAGEITFAGAPVSFRSPYEAQHAGISPIYQEINLVSLRSVAENVFLGRELRRGPFLDHAAMYRETSALLERVGVSVDPRAPLGSLSTAQQQMVAIARALSFRSQVLIMDEPTSSLHDREVETLFGVIRLLRESGVSVVFISHKLDELYRICDRITILRDGRTVAAGVPLSGMSRLELVSTMLGREPDAIESSGQTAFTRHASAGRGALLQTRDLAAGSKLRRASVTVRPGEVMGVAGLLGSGRTELAQAVYGATPPDAGTMELDGKPYRPRSARDGLRHGVVLTPEDRKTEGLVGLMSVKENITLSLLRRISRFGVIRRADEARLVRRYVERLGIKVQNHDQAVSELSGGNQQKVLLARALALEPRLLILDEPTRGVDVGAKREIQRLVSESVGADRGVMLISSEMEEIIEGSDRIQILRDGESVAFLDARSVSNTQIMIYMASGGGDDVEPELTEEEAQ
jgi:ribose transport system ATP-binding protein